MAKDYKTKSGKVIVGWIYKNGRRIPITKSVNLQNESKLDKGAEKQLRKAKGEYELAKRITDGARHDRDFKEANKHVEKARKHMDEYRRKLNGEGGTASQKQKDTIKESLKRRKNRDYRGTDTSEAIMQIENKAKTPKGKKPLPTSNSLSGNVDRNGKLIPQREKVHRRVLDEHFKGKKPAEGQPTLTLFGGGSASGKDSIFGVDEAKRDDHTVVIDPDYIKTRLPHYTEMANASDKTAGFFHEESSALAKRVSLVAYDEGYDTIYNGTGDGSPNSLQKKIDDARAKGYRVEGKYATVDTEEAVRRNKFRYQHAKEKGENPRLVSEDEVRRIHAAVTDRALEFAPKFDGFELWDNNGEKGEQKLIAVKGKGGYLQAVKGQEDAFIKFIKKSNKDYFGNQSGKVAFYVINGEVIPIVIS